MNRSDYDRLLRTVVCMHNTTFHEAVQTLRAAGVVPDASSGVSALYADAEEALGLVRDDRPIAVIEADLGWEHSGPSNIEYVSQSIVFNQRRLVLVQFEEDGQSSVHLYSFDLVDIGRWWQLEVPAVSARS